MRLALLLLPALLLAGCAQSPQEPAGDANTQTANCAFAPDIEGCKRELARQEAEREAQTTTPTPDDAETNSTADGPANPTMGLASAGALVEGRKTYAVSSATEGLLVRHLALHIGGTPWTFVVNSDACADHSKIPAGSWAACINSEGALTGESSIQAGHQIVLAGVEAAQDFIVVYEPTDKTLVTLKLR